jgi:hypothetical protein
MKFLNKVVFLVLVCLVTFSTTMFAHSGRTDSSGGHNCSAKSVSKGLCSGYHYHNSGKSSGSSSSSSGSSSNNSSSASETKKITTPQYTKSTVSYFVNNKEIILNPKPILKANSIYFPIREVASSLGAGINWDEVDSTITITLQEKKVVLNTKGDKLIVISNVTYASIRSIAEGLGVTINYDSDKNAIYVQVK